MIDFSDIRAATKSEAIRAWSVEQSIDHLRFDVPHQDIILLSKMIEDFVINGDVTAVVQSAVEEGYSEGRYMVMQTMEDEGWDVDALKDLFVRKGWMKKPETEDTTEEK